MGSRTSKTSGTGAAASSASSGGFQDNLANTFPGLVRAPRVPKAIGDVDVVAGLFSFAQRFAIYAWSAFYLIFAVLFFGYIFGTYLGIGIDAVFIVPLRRFLKKFEEAVENLFGETSVGKNLWSHLIYRCIRFVVLLPWQIFYGLVRTAFFFFASLGVTLSLIVLYAIFIQFTANGAFDLTAVDSGTTLVRTAWNYGGGLFNGVLDLSDAVLLPIYNVYMYFSIQYYRILYLTTVDAVNNPDGTLLAFLGKSTTQSSQQVEPPDFVSFSSQFGGGRRLSTSFGDGQKAGIQADGVFLTLHMFALYIAWLFDLIFTFALILVEILAKILLPVIVQILPAIQEAMTTIACIIGAPNGCGWKQIGQIFADGIVTIGNAIAAGLIGLLNYLPGVNLSAPTIGRWEVACSAYELRSVACDCAFFFENKQTCPVSRVSCTQDADGQWNEIQIDPNTGAARSISTSPQRSVACPASGRLLSEQPHETMEQLFGKTHCVHVCVNGTMSMETCGDGTMRYRDAAECNFQSLAADGPSQRRRELVSEMEVQSYMHQIMGVQPHRQARIVDAKGRVVVVQDASVDPLKEIVDQETFTDRAKVAWDNHRKDAERLLQMKCSDTAEDTVRNKFTRYAEWRCLFGVSIAHTVNVVKLTTRRRLQVFESKSAWEFPEKFRRSAMPAVRLLAFARLRASEFVARKDLPLDERIRQLTRAPDNPIVRRAGRRLQEEGFQFHAPCTHAVQRMLEGVPQALQNFRRHVGVEPDGDYLDHASHGRDLGVQVTRAPTIAKYGIFTPSQSCAGNLYLCPGGSTGTGCVVDKSTCQLPPNSSGAVYLEYQFLQWTIWAEGLDIVQLLNFAQKCWRNYETYPETNPIALVNIFKTSDAFVYCPPLVRKWPFGRAERMTFDFKEFVAQECNNASEPCTCPWYWTGILVTGQESYNEVSRTMLAVFHDGFGSFWTLFTLVTTWDTDFALYWTGSFMAARPAVPDTLLYFWNGMGQTGSKSNILFCALFHFPALFLCIEFVVVLSCVWLGMFYVLFHILRDLIAIILGFVLIFYEITVNRNLLMENVDAKTFQQFYDETFDEFTSYLRDTFDMGNSKTPPDDFARKKDDDLRQPRRRSRNPFAPRTPPQASPERGPTSV